jgi:hypothetical protein
VIWITDGPPGGANQAIRAIVPFSAESNTDTIAGTVADQLSAQLGQTIVVENRTSKPREIEFLRSTMSPESQRYVRRPTLTGYFQSTPGVPEKTLA